MHVMFAEDIGPWLAAAALFFGGLGASVLALGALFPASRGNRHLTFLLITPALIMVILTTCWLARGFFQREGHDQEEIIDNYVQPWFFMAFLPLIAGALPCLVLWFKQRKRARTL